MGDCLPPDRIEAAACQLSLRVGDVAGNRAAAAAGIAAAATRGAQLVVLPELTPSGYAFADFAEAERLAEVADGPTCREWTALARRYGLVIVGGICERDGGRLRNTAIVVDADGLRATYRKVHLWDTEAAVFTPGDQPPAVVPTACGELATMVCYDLEFPEWVRLPALAGADLLAAPTNWPLEPPRGMPTQLEVVRVQAIASVNRLPIVAADRCGDERGIRWVGGSCLVAATGRLLAGPPLGPDATVLTATIDLAEGRDKRSSSRNHVFADRRPDLYGAVLAAPYQDDPGSMDA